MSIVSNFVGYVSPEMFNGDAKGISQSFDLGDTAFSDLLEKQINSELQKSDQNFYKSFGLPTDITIGNINKAASQFYTNDAGVNMGMNNDMLESVKPISESEKSLSEDLSNPKNMSTSEVVTFFSSLFDSKPTMADSSSNGLFDFERKTAANLYNKYAKNIVTDINEFVTDAFRKD